MLSGSIQSSLGFHVPVISKSLKREPLVSYRDSSNEKPIAKSLGKEGVVLFDTGFQTICINIRKNKESLESSIDWPY